MVPRAPVVRPRPADSEEEISEHRPFQRLHLLPSAPYQLVNEVYWHLAHQLGAAGRKSAIANAELTRLNGAYEQILQLDRRMKDEAWEVYIGEEGTRRRPSWLPTGTIRGWLWQRVNQEERLPSKPWALLHVDPDAPPDIIELAFSYCKNYLRSKHGDAKYLGQLADLRKAHDAVLSSSAGSQPGPPRPTRAAPKEKRPFTNSEHLFLPPMPIRGVPPTREEDPSEGAKDGSRTDSRQQTIFKPPLPRKDDLGSQVGQLSQPDDAPATQGHVALYAKDEQWRRAAAASLASAGHSHHEAGTAEEVRRLLDYQRFDVLVLKVDADAEALDLAQRLEEAVPPIHTILLGTSGALPALMERGGAGTFRFVSGTLSAVDLSRLVDTSINAGVWREGVSDSVGGDRFEVVELEEMIERAASSVHLQARRKHHPFHVFVSGSNELRLADRAKLGRTLGTLLRLIITLAPRGTPIYVEARARVEGWTITVRAESGARHVAHAAQVAEDLGEDPELLSALSRDVREQGGVLWVELAGPASPAMCLMLPNSTP